MVTQAPLLILNPQELAATEVFCPDIAFFVAVALIAIIQDVQLPLCQQRLLFLFELKCQQDSSKLSPLGVQHYENFLLSLWGGVGLSWESLKSRLIKFEWHWHQHWTCQDMLKKLEKAWTLGHIKHTFVHAIFEQALCSTHWKYLKMQ